MPEYVVPPIIQDWINKINDSNTPFHVKENICMMLDNVKDACGKEVDKHRKNKSVFVDISSQKKKRVVRKK